MLSVYCYNTHFSSDLVQLQFCYKAGYVNALVLRMVQNGEKSENIDIRGLANLKCLYLQSNGIHTIKQDIFSPILPVKENNLKIDLMHNEISDFSWTSFMRSFNINLSNDQKDHLTFLLMLTPLSVQETSVG